MFGWILKITILSTIFILLFHHLIHFLTNTLTIPKTKDLVSSSSKKYEDIFAIIAQAPINRSQEQSTDIHLLPTSSLDSTSFDTINLENSSLSMKDELKNFLKTQWTDTSSSSEEKIVSFDSSSISSFASF